MEEIPGQYLRRHGRLSLVLPYLLRRQQELTGKDAISIFAEFGLRLVNVTRVPFFQPLVLMTQEQDDRTIDRDRSPMTVNYSKFLAILNVNEWEYIAFSQLSD